MVAVLDVVMLKREDPAGVMTDFGQKLMCDETFSDHSFTHFYLKRLGFVSTDTFLLRSLICMSSRYTPPPLEKKPILVTLIMFHIVFVCTAFNFYRPLYWCLWWTVYAANIDAPSPCTWSYISIKCKRASSDSTLNHFNVLEWERF